MVYQAPGGRTAREITQYAANLVKATEAVAAAHELEGIIQCLIPAARTLPGSKNLAEILRLAAEEAGQVHERLLPKPPRGRR